MNLHDRLAALLHDLGTPPEDAALIEQAHLDAQQWAQGRPSKFWCRLALGWRTGTPGAATRTVA